MLNCSSVKSQGWVTPTTKTLLELQMSLSFSIFNHNPHFTDT